MRKIRIVAALAALLLAMGGLVAVAQPAYAACGDTEAQWSGSTWSGTVDSSSGLTVALVGPVLGVRPAATVVPGLTGTGTGTWAFVGDLRWTAAVAGVWAWTFEVGPSSCSGGQVDAAAGAGTDEFGGIHYISLTRTS